MVAREKLRIVRYNGLLLMDALPPFLERTLSFKRRVDNGGGPRKAVLVTVPLFRRQGAGFVVHAGLLGEVQASLARHAVSFELVDRRARLPRLDMRALDAVQWKPGQREAVEAIAASDGLGIVSAPTAFGKSFVIRQLCALWGHARVAVVAASSDVFKNLATELKLMFPGEVVLCGAGHEMANTRGEVKPGRILITMAQSLHKVPDDWPQVMLCDECHNYGADDKAGKLAQFYKVPRFGFTASEGKRGDGSNRLVTALFGPVIYHRTYQEAQEAGQLPPVDVWMYKVDGCSEIPVFTEFGEAAQFNRKNVWDNGFRNGMVANVASHLARENDSAVLVIVATTEHALRLRRLLPGCECVYGDVDAEKVAKFTRRGLWDASMPTKVDSEAVRQKVNAGWRGVVVATLKWSEGVDMPLLKYVVRADALASAIKSDQVPGRAVRPKALAVVVDFMDVFSKRLLSRSQARRREYEAKGWTVVDVT